MKYMFAVHILQSRFCQAVFGMSLVLGYFLLPKTPFPDTLTRVLSVIFVVSFAFSTTCLVRLMKDRVKESLILKKSFLNIITTVLGITALQACGITGPSCGAAVGGGILGFLFPGVTSHFLKEYQNIFIILYIALQGYALYTMQCFKTIRS